jgi:cyanophycinase
LATLSGSRMKRTANSSARPWLHTCAFARLFLRLPGLLLLFVTLSSLASDTPYRYFRVGNSSDAHPSSIKPGFALIGGGEDLNDAFLWLCKNSAGGDFLVLRATGDSEYNEYTKTLCHENSVATLVIPNRDAAQTPFVAESIRSAEAIFISGGDQANYVNFWRDTPVQKEINDAIGRGIPLGGTSAGLAVQGEFMYSAQNDPPDDGPDLSSTMALADPFHRRVVIVRGFLNIPILKATITDTHFSKRDRMGRLLVFMARILQSGDAKSIHAIGVDEHTAVLLDPDGSARVAGTGAAYFLSAASMPAECRQGASLTFEGVSVQKLTASDRFDIEHWHGGTISYTLSVRAGKVRSSQANGSIY